ncbi:hypothetical protein E308F_25530 [Moorella sp. E308F]|uniref:TadE/TadG family type IV pilus assembly protein n=1 Tax=Moorella sp. E308F TaxID=2572682 RepID=UPI0010FFBB75|nr:TadE/TadG family type IV pilus assembly protein [Moorella sp. E308F]GEA16309.1 hypothetical protein E308F_25530 [Moorella sp. E308F]
MAVLKKGEEGHVLEFTLFVGVIFFFIFGMLVYSMRANATSVCISAAREAARTLAVTHSEEQARARAAEVVQSSLYTGARAGTTRAGEPHKAFDPDQPNPERPDVILEDDGTWCRAWVYYHLPNAVPGLPRLLNRRASLLDRYITVGGYAVFKREVE